MKKILYVLASPLWDVQNVVRRAGFNPSADGIIYLNGMDIVPIPKPESGALRAWAAWGKVDIDMLDGMTEEFGPRMRLIDGFAWKGMPL